MSLDRAPRDYEDAVREALTAHSSLGELALSVAYDADLHALGLSSLETVRVILAVEAILGIEYPESAIDSVAGHNPNSPCGGPYRLQRITTL